MKCKLRDVLGELWGAVFLLAVIPALLWIVTSLTRDSSIASPVISGLIGPALGTGIGGFLAFWFERDARKKEAEAKNVTSSNMALFKIAGMHQAFADCWERGVRSHDMKMSPERGLEINSPQSGMFTHIKFDFDGLSFLLDLDEAASSALARLTVLEFHFRMLVETIEMRVRCLENASAFAHKTGGGMMSIRECLNLNPLMMERLITITDQYVAALEVGMPLAEKVCTELREALTTNFPKQNFSKVVFQRPKGFKV